MASNELLFAEEAAQFETKPRPVAWPVAVWIHAKRILSRWRRSPTVLISSVGMPVFSLLILIVMFKGMVELFTGREMDLAGISMMLAVSSMLTQAMMGAGATVQERHTGLMNRLDTFPGHRCAAYVGRILAEAVRAFITACITFAMGYIVGADFGGLVPALRLLGVFVLVAAATGVIGVMLGYLAETPQGAVGFAPLVMAAMFFNTAMMPRDMYAEALRPAVDISPVTAVAELGKNAMAGEFVAKNLWLFIAWFGGLSVLGIIVMAKKAAAERR